MKLTSRGDLPPSCMLEPVIIITCSDRRVLDCFHCLQSTAVGWFDLTPSETLHHSSPLLLILLEAGNNGGITRGLLQPSPIGAEAEFTGVERFKEKLQEKLSGFLLMLPTTSDLQPRTPNTCGCSTSYSVVRTVVVRSAEAEGSRVLLPLLLRVVTRLQFLRV